MRAGFSSARSTYTVEHSLTSSLQTPYHTSRANPPLYQAVPYVFDQNQDTYARHSGYDSCPHVSALGRDMRGMKDSNSDIL